VTVDACGCGRKRRKAMLRTTAWALVTCGVLIDLAALSYAENLVQAAAREKERRGTWQTTAREYTNEDLARLAEARQADEWLRALAIAQAQQSPGWLQTPSTADPRPAAGPLDDDDAIVIGEINKSTPEIRETPGDYGRVVSVSCVDRPSVEDSCLMSYLVPTDASGHTWWRDAPCQRKPSPWPTYNEEERDKTRCGFSPPPRGGLVTGVKPPDGSEKSPGGEARPWAHKILPDGNDATDLGGGRDSSAERPWSREVRPWADTDPGRSRDEGERGSRMQEGTQGSGAVPPPAPGPERGTGCGSSGTVGGSTGHGGGSGAPRVDSDSHPDRAETGGSDGVKSWSNRLR
jgi:hypothetical protein